MIAKKIFQSVLVVWTIIVSSVALAEKAVKISADTIPVYDENKLIVSVSAEQPVFTLKLKSNPTTGYSWFLREYDTNLVTPIKHIFQQTEPNTKKIIGAPTYELWTFRMKPAAFAFPQQTTIRLIYARPWEGTDNSTPITFTVMTLQKS